MATGAPIITFFGKPRANLEEARRLVVLGLHRIDEELQRLQEAETTTVQWFRRSLGPDDAADKAAGHVRRIELARRLMLSSGFKPLLQRLNQTVERANGLSAAVVDALTPVVDGSRPATEAAVAAQPSASAGVGNWRRDTRGLASPALTS